MTDFIKSKSKKAKEPEIFEAIEVTPKTVAKVYVSRYKDDLVYDPVLKSYVKRADKLQKK